MLSIQSEAANRGDGDDESAPVLLELVGSIAFPAGRILVPRCGAGHDVLALAGPSNVVIGVDARSGSPDRFEQLRRAAGVPRDFVCFATGDPATWIADAAFDAIWDAAWCASLAPAQRAAWAERVRELLVPGGALVVLIHPVPSLDPGELDALLAAGFDREELRPVARSHPARQGREWLGRWCRRR